MARRRRKTAGLLGESQVLARGAAHVLTVLKAWHPQSDDLRLALRAVLEFEASVTEARARLATPRAPGRGGDAAPEGDGASA